MDSKVIIVGAAACLGLGYLLYQYSDDGSSKQIFLTRDDVVRILRELRSEMLDVCLFASQIVAKFKEISDGPFPEECIKHHIMFNLSLGPKISKIEEKVYQRNSITKEAFENACTVTYASDTEIKELSNKVKNCFESSFLGNDFCLNEKIFDIMTPELVLRIFKEINDTTLLAMYDTIIEMNASGIYDKDNQTFQTELQRCSRNNEKYASKVFGKYGIDKWSQPANIIIQKAIELYCLNGQNFKGDIEMIREDANQKREELMMDRYDPEEFEAIRARLNEKPRIKEIGGEEVIREDANQKRVGLMIDRYGQKEFEDIYPDLSELPKLEDLRAVPFN